MIVRIVHLSICINIAIIVKLNKDFQFFFLTFLDNNGKQETSFKVQRLLEEKGRVWKNVGYVSFIHLLKTP